MTRTPSGGPAGDGARALATVCYNRSVPPALDHAPSTQAEPAPPPPLGTTYWFALASALLPLGVGILVFVAWLILRAEWLMFAGYGTILGGLMCVAVSLAAILWFARSERRAKRLRGPRVLRGVLSVLAVIGADFVAAFLIVVAAAELAREHRVEVRNESGATLHDARVVILGEPTRPLGDIPDGERLSTTFVVETETGWVLEARLGNEPSTELAEGYAMREFGDRAVLTVHERGVVSRER